MKKSTNIRQTGPSDTTAINPTKMAFRALIGVVILLAILLLSQPGFIDALGDNVSDRVTNSGGYDMHGGVTVGTAQLAPLFTDEVLYWQDDIVRWGEQRNLNPNLIATIMQIESCGDPYVSSNAGAQGLFQVMPFHFENGENQLNPEENAMAGLDHLVDCLQWSDYDVGVSFACYNGGPSVIGRPQSQWFQESRDYFVWGGGIYTDASNGQSESDTLAQWLAAGGSRLCAQAQNTLAQFNP